MAVSPEAFNSRRASIRSSIVCLISMCFAVLLLFSIGGSGEGARADGVGTQSDDWITINKDYSSQRYVDLDQSRPIMSAGSRRSAKSTSMSHPGSAAAS
jgi:hypothetical protein